MKKRLKQNLKLKQNSRQYQISLNWKKDKKNK